MAGTDRTRALEIGVGAPAVVLVDPQLGENIGMCARAMLNCGLGEMRIVRPRDGWPNEAAVAAASGADIVLEKAQLFETTAAAIADLHTVFATTARRRDMSKDVFSAAGAAAEMRAAPDQRFGVLFGGEAKGLKNDDIALADAILEIPLNPAFSSLNLAQAVLIVGYEWSRPRLEGEPAYLAMPGTRPATKDELIGLFEHLERELDAGGFLHVREKRPTMVRNLRNLLQRARLTEQEVRTLRGVIASLTRAFEKQD
jgi:tRNA/rRNA methyltransferase